VSAETPPEQADKPLVVDNLSKRFRRHGKSVVALDAVSLTVPPRGITGLVGPDAAGKTTLIRFVLGLLIPDAGSVRVLGLDPQSDADAVHRQVGYMPQSFGLYEDLSVQENLNLYADLCGVARRDRETRFSELLDMAGLAAFRSRLAGRLSGGMKQKLGLACALVRRPRFLVLDEPTVGVDPLSRRELWEIVTHMVSDRNTAVLISTTDFEEAERCDQVVLLHRGRVLEYGAPEDITSKMHNRVYRITAPDTQLEALRKALRTNDAVLDAVVREGHIRIVTAPDSGDALQAAVADLGTDARPESVAPTFEDAFVGGVRNEDEADDDGAESESLAHRVTGNGGAVIEAEELARSFGDFYAVKGITFGVERGEIFGLLGANGAGKTTTFRMLCGLLPVTSGKVRVAGADVRHAGSRARARLGYVAQAFALYGDLSVIENLKFFAAAYGLHGSRRRELIEWALTQFQLEERQHDAGKELPVGFQRRLALAVALIHEPEVLFLDEPTSGVDPLARRAFWRRIQALARNGVTVLVTTHFMAEAEYCDRLAIMERGEFLATGSPAEIRDKGRADSSGEPTLAAAFIQLLETHREREKEH
jgi:ABC-2 type transport system ATP-binding protein